MCPHARGSWDFGACMNHFPKHFWLPFISFTRMCLISEIAASFEEIGEITLAAALRIITTNSPQPRQSSSRIISCWEVQVWKRNAELTSRSCQGGLWKSEMIFLAMWDTNGFKAVCLGVRLGVPWKMPLRFLKKVIHSGLGDLQSIWGLSSFCIPLSGLSPSIFSSSCVSVTFKSMNFSLQSQEVLVCCCWGKGTWSNYAPENRAENISGGENSNCSQTSC